MQKLKYLMALGAAFVALQANASLVSQLPDNFVSCAQDYKACQFSGTSTTVYYGTDSSLVKVDNQTSGLICDPKGLGVNDPANGKAKSCYVNISVAKTPGATGKTFTTLPEGFEKCATDSKTCTVSGTWTGVYGANSVFKEIRGTGNFVCSPATFHISDPVAGVAKSCYVKKAASVAATTTSATPSASQIQGMNACTKDGGQCNITGNWQGYYGANQTFVPIKGTGSFTCLPKNLGVADPLPGIQKTCYINAEAKLGSGFVDVLPTNAASCAVDGKTCSRNGQWQGLYGANGKFALISGSGSFVCLPSTFGIADPVPGVQKTCYITKAEATSGNSTVSSIDASFTACAVDGGNCAQNGQWTGYYGANNKFVQISGSTSFICLPNTFGIADPVPGVKKTCYVKAVATQNSGDICKFVAGGGQQYARNRPSESLCGCTCAANAAQSCFYGSTQLRTFSCSPGEYP